MIGLELAIDERTNAVRIAEREQAVTRDHRHDGIRAAAAPVHARHGGEDRRRIELVIGRPFLQFVREHVQQNFGIRIRIDVPQILPEKIALQLLGIRKIAVVTQYDAKRRVDVKRLRLRCRPRCKSSFLLRGVNWDNCFKSMIVNPLSVQTYRFKLSTKISDISCDGNHGCTFKR